MNKSSTTYTRWWKERFFKTRVGFGIDLLLYPSLAVEGVLKVHGVRGLAKNKAAPWLRAIVQSHMTHTQTKACCDHDQMDYSIPYSTRPENGLAYILYRT